MKRFLFFIFLVGALPLLAAPPPPPAAVPPARPPITLQPPGGPSGEVYVYEQKPYGTRPLLLSPEHAQSIIDRFKTFYGAMGKPRIVIYVNRDLIDEETGLKLRSRAEKVETTRGPNSSDKGADDPKGASEKISSENIYRAKEKTPAPLADKQTVRDVERLFGRPLRMAGATLADHHVAAELIAPSRSLGPTAEGERARKEREALGKVADIAIEVLISSRNIAVEQLSGQQVYAMPDIHATAIRLSDARILGQTTSSDLTGRYSPTLVAPSLDVREITEATALALMEDMAR